MASDSMKYFFDNNDSLLTDQIVGYFDFSNTGISGLINVPSENWTSSSTSLQLINSGEFWSKSGFGFFNKENYARLNTDNNQFLSFIFAYKINEKSDNIFIANYNNFSGFNFGINYAGYPYVEYSHKIYGPITACHTSKASNTGVIYFSIEDQVAVSVGIFNAESNSFEKIFRNIDQNITKSNHYYIGGSPHVASNRFLSADISEIFIYNPNYIGSTLFEDQFVSGVVCSLLSNTVTGIISGETGVLNGDIIEVKQCSVGTSGVLSEVLLSTGDGEYFATHSSFLDFNNEVFNTFYQNISTGYFSGYVTGQNSILFCSAPFTGRTVFEYDSGYSIEYTITNTSAFISRPEYLYNYYNGIALSYIIDQDDILSIYGYSKTDSRINFFDLYYNNSDGSYGHNNILNDFSGLYYNGQLQTRSTGYYEIIQSGDITYVPSEDYLISGNQIFNNSYYGRLEGNTALIDFWPKSILVMTGQINSGQSVFGVDFLNSLVFLNGQLLNSGTDYSGSNIILRNIDSGYNVLTVQKNTLDLNKNIISNLSGSSFLTNFNFNKNMSLVWLNGQRLSLGKDYSEFKKGTELDILTQNSGVIIYNLQF